MTASTILTRLLDSFTPKQLCWICLLVTVMGAGLGSTYAIRAFASTESVKAVKQQVTRMEVRLLEREIFDRMSQMCSAIKAQQPARVYRERLQEALRAYQELTGNPFILPRCDEL